MSLLFHRGNVGNDGGGTEKIEEIREGDLVLAYDEETGEQAYKPVVRLFRNESKDWVGVTVDGKETISTPGHKYYVPENEAERNFGEVLEHAGYAGLSEKWVSAQNLKFGDKVLLSDGTYGIIQTVKVETLSVPETTYNFEVEDFHTYFVGEQSVCVHNADCNISEMKYEDLPEDVKYAYDQYAKNGWKGNVKGQSTNAGGKWMNSDLKLPTKDALGKSITYREFDVGMNMPRGASRFVVGSDMTVYYTPDHYATFFKILGG